MLHWLRHVVRDTGHLASHCWSALLGHTATPREERSFRLLGMLLALLCVVITSAMVAPITYDYVVPKLPEAAQELFVPEVDYTVPIRAIPPSFRANSYMPRIREGRASGSIDLATFSASRDLIRIEDDRVWWESEHDHGDTEDDHVFHHAMEDPMRRLIELVHKEGATLKVQDAYRDRGIHAPRSLHKEGRAVDLTAEGMSLQRLAQLSWAAGFDWVYFEAPKRGGAHIHASVKRERTL